VDRRFDAGDRRGACDAFLMWNKAGGHAVAGLTNRRRAERALCLKGIK
jgi:lysozyme